jgi:hypothetical protein
VSRITPPAAGGIKRSGGRRNEGAAIARLVEEFDICEVLGEIDGNEGNFEDGIWVQEVVNAVEISHHERRWVNLPLTNGPGGASE